MFAVSASDKIWVWDLVGLLAVPALVALNGVFVAAEFALVAVRRTRVEELVKQGVKGAKALEIAITRIDRSIAATQLGITFASLGLGWISEPALAHVMQPLFDFLTPSWSEFATHSAATVTTFFLITFLEVVFGELIPKTIALQTADRTGLWMAPPLNLFAWLTRPIILIMSFTANRILRAAGYKAAGGAEMVHSIEELALLIEDTEEAGLLDEDQAEFVRNVFHLSGKHVADCLVPRDKIAALDLNSPPETILERVRHGAHTRMPVYNGELDNIVGVVNTKDLFYLFSLRGVVILEDAMYPALFLKPDESVATALRLFRQARRPMALVRDESGKIHGLITLEDVLEEIVGDIEDEHDRPTPKVTLRHFKRPAPRPTVNLPPTRKT